MGPSKSEKLYDGITSVREDIIDHARELGEKKKRRPWWPAAVAAVLVAALVSGIVLWPRSSPLATSASALATAEYPEMVPYPNKEDYWNADGSYDDEGYGEAYYAWWTNSQTFFSDQYPELVKSPQAEDYQSADGSLTEAYWEARQAYRDSLDHFFHELNWPDSMAGFLTAATEEFLTDAGTENRVYSPMNVYMALAMLAETTDGNSRQQILDFLGADSIETLRTQATAVWRAHYMNDGHTISVLASSLWLNQDVSYQQSTLDTLAETYYASTFQGKMGTEDYNQALRDWLNEQTGGLLSEQAQGLEMDADTILTIAATLYLKAQWSSEFWEQNTAPDLFHTAGGDTITCDFMHKSDSQSYYWGDHFSAVSLDLDNIGSMWFLLPDEGASVDELLTSGEAMAFLLSGKETRAWKNQTCLTVNLSLPKFDVSSDLDLTDGLKNLGVTDVFDSTISDFSPLTGSAEDEIYVSQASHAARVTIDEKGCTAAAYTVVEAANGDAPPPEDEVDFVLDRPFLFAITSDRGLPLFVGVVNQPV